MFDPAYSHLKPAKNEAPWFHEVPSQVYRNAMYQRGQAWAKYWDDPAHVGRPGRRKKGENDSVLLTNELFQFWGAGLVLIGTPRFPVGVVEYHEHRPCGEPNSVTISKDRCGRWWLSFTFDDGREKQSEGSILARLETKTDAELAALTVGFDRGITQQVTGSDGSVHGYDAQKKARFAKYLRRQRALQKKLSRQTDKSSRRRGRTRVKLAKVSAQITSLRTDHAHQVSHRIVGHSPAEVLAFEALKLGNMTRRAKPVLAESGDHYEENGAAAKSALNRSLLHQSLGLILRFIRYKALRAGKLVVEVPAAGTSQRCSCCGHTESDNRKGSHFTCKKCGHQAHADANASVNIQSDGVSAVLTLLGRIRVQPCAEATRERLTPLLKAPSKRTTSRHLAA